MEQNENQNEQNRRKSTRLRSTDPINITGNTVNKWNTKDS